MPILTSNSVLRTSSQCRDPPPNTRGPLPAAKTASPAQTLPAWYPAWARELADLYFSGTTCLFILHGNVHDLIHCPDGRSRTPIAAWRSFSPRRSSARWDLVLGYDLSQGLRPQAGTQRRAAAGDACKR